MAEIWVSDSYALRMYKLDLSTLYSGKSYVRSSTEFIVKYPNGFADKFTGAGFRYNGSGEPIAGTVETYAGVNKGKVAFELRDVSIRAFDIVKAARTYSTLDDERLFARTLDGDDIVYGGRRGDSLDAYGGDDRVVGGDGSDVLNGGSGSDRILGGDGSDLLQGEAGNDQLVGGAGSDRLEGGSGDDALFADAADAKMGAIDGGPGTDTLTFAGDGEPVVLKYYDYSSIERVVTGSGDDLVQSRAGLATVSLGAGDDTFIPSSAKEDVKGGPGIDVLQFSKAVSINLKYPALNSKAAIGDTYIAFENVVGSRSGNSLAGSDGRNELFGGPGRGHLDRLRRRGYSVWWQ